MNLKSEYERKSMNSLFEPYDLAGRTLRNRFVMAPRPAPAPQAA